jgi:predicted DNA-binding protein
VGKFRAEYPTMASCRLSEADAEKLAQLVQATGRDKSALLRQLIREAVLEKEEVATEVS